MKKMRRPQRILKTWIFGVAFLGGLSVGCVSESTENQQTPASVDAMEDSSSGASVNTGQAEPSPIAALSPGWNELLPEGDTVCSRGGEYAFFVHNGTSNRLVIEFEGGGACWTQGTCSVADAIFKDSVDDDRAAYAAGFLPGVLNHENPANPFQDWHHIFVPYCTGDVHIGNAEHIYGEGDDAFTIRHKGAVNVGAVMEWARTHIPDPDVIFVTGCSAGAYGSIFWVPHIAQQYPEAQIYQMGDSGCGVITQTFMDDSFPIWEGAGILPDWIDALKPETLDIANTKLHEVYIHLAEFYGDTLFSQFTTVKDNNQVFYFEAMGGSGEEEWSQQMLSSLGEIATTSENFRRFIAPGDTHCILPHEEFFTLEVEGVKLVDWLADLVAGIEVPEVICSGCTLSN